MVSSTCSAGFPKGILFENAVYLNLKKFGNLFYYQRRKGNEMDFLLQDSKFGFEVKTEADPIYLKKLENLSVQLKLNDHYLITKEYPNISKSILAMDI